LHPPLIVYASAPRIEFYEAADGRRLAVRVWDALGAPRARAVLLHGVTSHGGWYARSCHHLANAGCEVHFLDRRGSGLNRELPGDVDRWQTWLDDVTVYLRQLRGPAPVVLCGISWGGKLAAAVARREPGLMQALALICPGLYSPHEPGVLRRLALSTPAPARWQERRVRIPLRRPELFTDTPSWQEFIAHDPLTLREITWRFAREDRRLTRYARRSAPLLHMPLLVMLAGRDRIINNRRVMKFFRRSGAIQRTLIEYANACHTLEFEPDPAPYFADLRAWLTATVGDSAPRDVCTS
jgi:alpha-beta hydrolase superfamily lysophospholipase